jgi:hypothetical protein
MVFNNKISNEICIHIYILLRINLTYAVKLIDIIKLIN